jgi:hypothetical protein
MAPEENVGHIFRGDTEQYEQATTSSEAPRSKVAGAPKQYPRAHRTDKPINI